MRLGYDPGRLIDADLELILEERLSGDASKGHLPAYRFAMHQIGKETKIGEIGLRDEPGGPGAGVPLALG